MKPDILLSLFDNAILLLAIAAVYDLLSSKDSRIKNSMHRKMLTGFFLGLLGCGLILAAYLFKPGVIFDTRSVLLSVSGLFFGPIPTLIAIGMTAIVRLIQGGSAWVGISVIFCTGGVGLLWRHLRRGPLETISAGELYLFGLLTHVVMLALMFLLPPETALSVIASIGLPVLIIYPLATVLLGLLLASRLHRKQTAAALSESETLASNLLNNLPDLVWIKDPDGVYLNCNRRFEVLYGASANEIKGQTDYDFISKEQADAFRENDLKAIANQGPTVIEERIPSSSDEFPMHLETIKTPLYDALGKLVGVLGVGRDITERNRAKEVLLAEKIYSESLITSMPGVFYLISQAGRFLRWNTKFEVVTGRSAEEMEQISPIDLFEGDDKQAIAAAIDQVFTLGQGQVEGHFVAKGGTRTPYQFNGKKIIVDGAPCLIGLGLDVTARKQAEKKLKESEEHFKSIVEQSPLSTQIFTPDGWTEQINRAYEHLWGVTMNDLQRYNILEDQQLVSLGIMPYIQGAFSGEAASIPAAEFDTVKSLGIGKKMWIRARIYPVKDPVGNISKIILIHEDITDQKLAKEKLTASEERFRTICENAPALIDGFDENGRCIMWNEQCRKTFGWTIEEINAQDVAMPLLYPDPTTRAEVLQTVTSDPDGHFREWYPKTKDGRTLTTQWANFRLPNGQVFSLGYDDTERKRAEEELRKSRDELDLRVQERTTELRTIVNTMVGRENRMADLKLLINALRTQLEEAGMKPVDVDPGEEDLL